MNFVWDEKKRSINLKKHGLDFVDAEKVFQGAAFTFANDRFFYGEDRWITMGLLLGMVVVIAHMEDEQAETIRVISLRKASKNEQKIFFENLSN